MAKVGAAWDVVRTKTGWRTVNIYYRCPRCGKKGVRWQNSWYSVWICKYCDAVNDDPRPEA